LPLTVYHTNFIVNTDASEYEPSYFCTFNSPLQSCAALEYTYDANGYLTRDSHKKIAKIQYNILNLPSALQFIQGHTTEYLYDASGVKRRVKQITAVPDMFVSMGTIRPVSNDSIKEINQTDYCGNMIYGNGTLSRILVDGGYITMSGTTPTYHYYIQDHLGNNRIVFNQSGTIEQTNHYYPFGMTFGEGVNNSANRYKYNDKELDRMHGLDLYDYNARMQDGMRFTTMDPLAESTPNISPYAYCFNNPVNAVDPDGRDSYLLVWFSKDGETGHSGIAIDNYKRQEIKDSKGNAVLDSKGNHTYEMVKDGTMTYYDLWPNNPVGKTELQSDVKSDYSKGVKINCLSDLTTKDPTGSRNGNVSAEGRATDGIVRVNTTYEQDSKIKNYASTTARSGKAYKASDFNCSTFAESALKSVFQKLDASQYVNVPFPLNTMYNDTRVTAPNNLYNAVMKLSGAKNIKGPKSVIAKPYLKYYGK